ncbi:MAG: SusC/RagA family TonB-linked outer membrane protein [Polaribacter sp.]|uniref:SusC/RagA family TonB-linked outer membrane protein n=1 Tax=Polaribacter sp. TaxID=1920175 RepID=UPI00326401C4
MRTVLLLFCSTLFSFTSSDIISQNAKIIIKENKTVTVDEVFDIVQAQTDYTFIYRSDLFEDFPLVTLNKGIIKVKDLLSNAISNDEYHIELLKHNTIVIEKEVSRIIQEEITGTVTDEEKIPLVGVTVQIKGTKKGVSTDFDGNYSIPGLKTDDVLVFSSLGFQKQSIKVGDKKVINVVLKEAFNELDEVVVTGKKEVHTGYQVLSKAKSIGSYESVGAKVIETKFQTNILQRLEGTVSGLSLYKGFPVIRGTSTLYGDEYPLIVLDGVTYEGDLNTINPDDIENVTVLKDATATAIYGVRAANGVIVITTKVGTASKLTVSYRSSFQIEPLPSRSYQNYMTTPEFVDYQIDVFSTTITGTRKNSVLALDDVNKLLFAHEDGLISTDYLNSELDKIKKLDGYDQVVDEFLTPKYTQQHNLSLRGGSESHQYSFSLNYTARGSFQKDNTSETIGLNISNNFKLNDWLKFDTSLRTAYGYSGYYSGVFSLALIGNSRLPYEVLRDEEGNPVEWNHIKSDSEIERLISLGLLDQSYYPSNQWKEVEQKNESPSINLNFGTQIKLSESLNLQLRGQLGYGKSHSTTYSSVDSYTVRNTINDATQIINGEIINHIPYGGQISESFNDRNSYTLRAQLNYSKLFNNKHDIKVLLGGERSKSVTSYSGFRRYGYDNENLTFGAVDEATLADQIRSTEGVLGVFTLGSQPGYRVTDSRYISAYGNVSYMFKNKLGLNVNARIDESNLFGKNPKYAYRPLWSFGANYIVDTKSLSIPWLDRLKIRATYGISGNVFTNGGPDAIATVFTDPNDVGEPHSVITSPPNEELRWEQTDITNIAVDYALFSKRLTGTVEFYNKSTKDAVAFVDSDPILGWSSLPKNYASLNNRGIEFKINSQLIKTEDFRLSSKLIFNYNRNKVTEFVEPPSTLVYNFLSNNQLREGQELETLYAIRYAGLDEKGAPQAYKADGTLVNSYLDLDPEDLLDMGTYAPPYNVSFSSNFTYKQFDLSFLFIYYGGHVQRDVAAGHYPSYRYPYELTGNLDRIHLNYWKEPGDEEDIYKAPAIYWNGGSANPNEVESAQRNIWTYADIHVQKANYIKLRNINLAYNVPKLILDKMNLSSLRLTLDVRNPFRWSNNRNNLDPETWSGDSGRGIAVMPTYTFALNLRF